MCVVYVSNIHVVTTCVPEVNDTGVHVEHTYIRGKYYRYTVYVYDPHRACMSSSDEPHVPRSPL